MQSENKKIGQKIRKARIASNLTQNELGKLIGNTGSAIGYLEAGLRKISPDTLKKIAEVLNKPFRYFYDEAEEEYFVHSKVLVLEKGVHELARLVKRTENKKFAHKEFYESIIDEIQKAVLFVGAENAIVLLNKWGKKLLKNIEIKEGSTKIQKIFPEFAKILKDNDKNIKTATLFNVNLAVANDKIAFSLKPVYEKQGKYLGLWMLEKQSMVVKKTAKK